MRLSCPSHTITLDLITLTALCEEYGAPQRAVFSVSRPLNSNIFLRKLFSIVENLCHVSDKNNVFKMFSKLNKYD
jgi:hypothetical protein